MVVQCGVGCGGQLRFAGLWPRGLGSTRVTEPPIVRGPRDEARYVGVNWPADNARGERRHIQMASAVAVKVQLSRIVEETRRRKEHMPPEARGIGLDHVLAAEARLHVLQPEVGDHAL